MTEDIAVTKFREYLRVNTEHPTPDYGIFHPESPCHHSNFTDACTKFLKSLAAELDIPVAVYEVNLRFNLRKKSNYNYPGIP